MSEECARLLDLVRERCPGLLPADPLRPGQVGPEVTLSERELQGVVRSSATSEAVVWRRNGSELLVHLAAVEVHLEVGIVVVLVPVRCDQTGNAMVTVAFAVGDDQRPAGMLAATEEQPRGPALVVDLWGEALTAFAWQALLGAAAGVAGSSGEDTDGAPLIPVALTAAAGSVSVLTMARHTFDTAG
ncbi:hypothetical protein [Saccharothrix stipae]